MKHSIPVILTITVLIIGLSPTLQNALQFDRDAIANGEIWRLVTGNLAHLNWPHLWMNTAGLWLIWLLVQQFLTTKQWLTCLLVTTLGVSIGLYLFKPEIQWYVGLSGMLHGLLIAPLIGNFKKNCPADHLLLLLVASKTIWEQFSGPMSTSESLIKGHVVTEAHLFGAISGLIFAIILIIFRSKKED